MFWGKQFARKITNSVPVSRNPHLEPVLQKLCSHQEGNTLNNSLQMCANYQLMPFSSRFTHHCLFCKNGACPLMEPAN